MGGKRGERQSMKLFQNSSQTHLKIGIKAIQYTRLSVHNWIDSLRYYCNSFDQDALTLSLMNAR